MCSPLGYGGPAYFVALLGMPTLVVWAAGGRVGSLPNLIALLIVLPLVGLAVYWGDPRLHRPVVQAGEPASVVGGINADDG